MKCIFLAEQAAAVRDVYAGDVLTNITAAAGIPPNGLLTAKDLKRRSRELADTEFIFSTWTMPALTEEQLAALLPNLRAVFYAAGSVKYFAAPFLNRGVRIYSAAAANAIPVAEFVVAQTILANKGYFSAQSMYTRRRYRSARQAAEAHHGNFRAKVGVIGAGFVGTKVVELLRPYDIEVLVHDPYLDAQRAHDLGCQPASLAALFSECSVISNHLPDIEDTRGILNYQLFGAMGDTATFINTGRGAQVDEPGLLRALREKPGRTAILDVTRREPPGPASPLHRMPNVFLTPHIAGSLHHERARMAECMLTAYQAHVAGDRSPHEVTTSALARMA
jgi:phosphoglycerate dehydrogenase-like enzyme